MKKLKVILIIICCSFFISSNSNDSISIDNSDSTSLLKENINPEEDSVENNESKSIWLYISLILIILVFLKKYKNRSDRGTNNMNEEDKDGEGDWSEVFITLGNKDKAKKLYDKLIRKAHPDRFPNDEEKRKIAEKITQELGGAIKAFHLTKLQKLEKRINNELNV